MTNDDDVDDNKNSLTKVHRSYEDCETRWNFLNLLLQMVGLQK